ncbi:MAG: hypothetical protein M9942_00090 [Microthrixaceae bacterium]|nr:hypothetical protein [Microthrixaceae bacterium]
MPFSMNTARSARVSATLIDCSTTTMVIPLRWSVRTTSHSAATINGDRPRDSSSMSITRGRSMRVIAIASCCCSPPERSPANCDPRSASTGNSSRTSSRESSILRWSRLKVQVARRRWSSTVMVGKMALPPGMRAMPRSTMRSGERPETSTPSMRTEPWWPASPQMPFNSVDLPAPLVPSRATTSLRFTRRSTPKSTWRAP